MSHAQPGILLPGPDAAEFLTFRLKDPGDAPAVLTALARLPVTDHTVVGLGEPLLRALGATVDGLRNFPAMTAPGVAVPSTQGAAWAYVRGRDPGEALDHARALSAALSPLVLDEDVPTFCYRGGRDLSGFVDGTENPKDDAAAEAAVVDGGGPGHDGGSFVAAQRWVHDLGAMARMSPEARNHVVGRDLETNVELTDAPPSAHVKRSAQESFDPAAFMLRRSQPYGNAQEHGLYFVAFGADLDRYERVMRRMCGLDDGIADALFRFSRPVTGGYYWCPPTRDGTLDLRALAGAPAAS